MSNNLDTTTFQNNSDNLPVKIQSLDMDLISKNGKLAPVQVSTQKLVDLANKIPDMEGQSEFNIWFSKWTGKSINPIKDPSQFRCIIKRDSGITIGSYDLSSSFCVFFAKGRCPNGHRCRFWHRLPNNEDKSSLTKDCFGRDRFADYKQDMGGVGSFIRECRTLQISRFAILDEEEDDDKESNNANKENQLYKRNEDMIRRHFSEWGPIEQIKVIPSQNMAFVKYTKRIYAEFAKEAMSNQSLDRREVINVRWASKEDDLEDKEEQKRIAREIVFNAVKRKLPQDYAKTVFGDNQHEYNSIMESGNETQYQNEESAKTKHSTILSDRIIESLSKKRKSAKTHTNAKNENPLRLLAEYQSSDENNSQDESD